MKDIVSFLEESLRAAINEAYQEGYEIGHKRGHYEGEEIGMLYAWGCARRLTHPRNGGYYDNEKKEIFGYGNSDDILMNYSASEALRKIGEYEKKNEKCCMTCGHIKSRGDRCDLFKEGKHCDGFTEWIPKQTEQDKIEEKQAQAENKIKENTHKVIKIKDIDKYLSAEQQDNLIDILQIIADGREKDGKKRNNTYYICNTDEPYADKVIDAILCGENLKDTHSFGKTEPEYNESELFADGESVMTIKEKDPTTLDFLSFLYNNINPNKMEQYISMYQSGDIPTNGE